MIETGTANTKTVHSEFWGPVGFMFSMVVPVLLFLLGLASYGFGAVSWIAAIFWGVVATFAFTLFSMMGKTTGMTRMDLADLLGSTMAPPGTSESRRLGFVLHHVNGALLALAWAYGAALFRIPADWLSGLLWGVVLWGLALLMMSSLGSVHPAIRRGEQEDPGTAAMNFGAMTPIGSLVGHLVYGLVLGWGYAA